MSVVLGLTGMTGAGKSTASSYFAKKGARIVDADIIARSAVLDNAVIKSLTDAFGCDITDENGQIIRSALAKKAFANNDSAELLSKITHPFILKEMERQILEYKKENIPIIIVDAPLLYQSKADEMCDRVLFIDADREVKLSRIMARDGITRDMAEDRINVQNDMEKYKGKSDFVLFNNGNVDELYSQCDNIIERIG